MPFILSPEIDDYIENHTSEQDEVLQSLERNTHLNFLMPRMLSGKVQGLSLIHI